MASPGGGRLRAAPVAWLVALLAAVLGLSGCSDGDAAAKPGPIRIGVILDRSGPAKQVGAEQEESLNLAVDVVNQRGGIDGRTIELVVEDDMSSPATAAKLATELTADDSISLLVGSSSAATTQAIRPIAEAGYRALLAPVAAGGIDDSSGWVFSTGLDPSLQVNALIGNLAANGVSSLGLLLEDSAASSGVADLVTEAAAGAGIGVVGQAQFSAAGTDLAGQIDPVVAAEPQAVLMWGRPSNLASVASAYHALGGTGQMAFSADAASPSWLADVGDDAEGAIAASSKVLVADKLGDDPADKPAKDFVTEFAGQYGDQPSAAAGYAYDAITLALQTLDSGGPDARPREIRDRLENTGEFAGVTGSFVIGPQEHSALPPDSAIVVTCTDGTWVPT